MSHAFGVAATADMASGAGLRAGLDNGLATAIHESSGLGMRPEDRRYDRQGPGGR
jgi:hypothetical protein